MQDKTGISLNIEHINELHVILHNKYTPVCIVKPVALISLFRPPLDVAASISADALETKLEMLSDMGEIKVTREGDCAGYTWTIEWATLGGDHPQMEVNEDNFIHG